MKAVFIGCVEFSRFLLERVSLLPDIKLVGIVTREESSFHGDFCSLAPFASYHAIPCFIDKGNKQQEMASWIRVLNPDVIYCFGWPYLLGREILVVPRLGVVGYHPTKLPRNRGRHPIIWTLALGLAETSSTFFMMDEGADSGDIISQEMLPVLNSDDAASLYEKLKMAASQQVTKFTSELVSGMIERIPQDHDKANTWRKRSKKDGEIDWRMPAQGIYNLIRALAKPYVGAHCLSQGRNVKVWQAVVADDWGESSISHLEPGKVLRSGESVLDVKCGIGVLRILQHEFEYMPKEGEYL